MMNAIETLLGFDPGLLVPEQRIRELCAEDKCGNYQKHYMCPPLVGSVGEMKRRLRKFRRGLLLQYSRPLGAARDAEELKQTKLDFHNIILQLEDFMRDAGVEPVWGMIGGACELCEVCGARTGKPCPYPDRARTSLESIGVDVQALLGGFGLDNEFRPHRITWTGCVLF